MRKLLSLFLALVMCVSLAACGGEDETPDPTEPSGGTVSEPDDPSGGAGSADNAADPADVSIPAEGEGDYCGNYDVLKNYELYVVLPMDRLTAASWNFSGGYANGVEMEQEELDNLLSVYSGTLQVQFVDDKTANLVQGSGTIPGTYRVLDDDASINFTFELDGTAFDYVGAFTAIGEDETPVLLFVSPEAPDTVFYMTN